LESVDAVAVVTGAKNWSESEYADNDSISNGSVNHYWDDIKYQM